MADVIKKKSNWSLLCGMIIGERLIQLFLLLIGWTSLWEKNTMLNKPNNSLSFISGLKILWRGVLDLNLFWISLDIFSRRKTQFTNKTITWISVMTWNQFSFPLVPVTSKNSTRYMTNFPSSNPIKSVKNGYDIRFGASDLELLEHEGKDFI